MKTRTALLELFKESHEWRVFFRSCCEYSAFRLRAQTWQFRDELTDRGHGFGSEELEYALLDLARELLPDTPAAQWDAEWAHELCKDALACLTKAYAGLAPVIPGVENQEDWEEHRDGILESLQPEGHLEEVLAQRVALLSWRLNRVTRYETETIALSQKKAEDDLADKRRFGSYVLGPSHPEDVRSAVQDARRVQRVIKQFPQAARR